MPFIRGPRGRIFENRVLKPTVAQAQVDWDKPDAQGLVAWWLFNEGGGNRAFDVTGNGWHGTTVNSPVWAAGLHGPAIDLELSSDQYVNTQLFTTGFTGLSCIAWVWFESIVTGAGNYIICQEDDAGKRPFVLRQMTGRFQFLTNSTGVNAAITIPTTGIWYHVAGTWDSANNRLYVNGILEDTDAQSGALQTGDNPVRLGEGTTYTGRQWDGILEQIMIFNRALGPSEIMRRFLEPYGLLI